VSDEPSKPRKPEPPWLGRLSRMGETAQRMQGKSRGTFGAASTVKMLMEWSCACGWQGTSRESQGWPGWARVPALRRRRVEAEVITRRSDQGRPQASRLGAFPACAAR
jgi:hypothetical protein